MYLTFFDDDTTYRIYAIKLPSNVILLDTELHDTILLITITWSRTRNMTTEG